jgi:hypothetical protein
MIEINVRHGLYHVRGSKFELCLTKAEFIEALPRAKRVKRCRGGEDTTIRRGQ